MSQSLFSLSDKKHLVSSRRKECNSYADIKHFLRDIPQAFFFPSVEVVCGIV